MYQIKVIDSMSKWVALHKAWNDLLEKSRSNTVFLTWEWLYTWAEQYLGENRQLLIVCVHKDGELIGAAPWYINKMRSKILTFRQLEFLGTPETGSDYLDVIITRGKEREVTHCIYNYLFNEVPMIWDNLLFRDINADSLFLLHFLNRIEDAGKYVEIQKGSFCPIMNLPKTTDEFYSILSPNRREQFRRHLRILERENKAEHRTFISGDIESGLNALFFLYEKKKGCKDDSLLSFLKKLSIRSNKKNWMQIDFLRVNGENISGLLHLRYNDTLFMYIMAIDKAFMPKISIGNILVGLCLEKAVKEAFSIYDFLKGSEEYKFHWANSGRSTLNILFHQKKVVPVFLAMTRFLKYIGKITLR